MENVEPTATPRSILAGNRCRGDDEKVYNRGVATKQAIPISIMLFRPILSERLPRGIEARRVERLMAEPRNPIMVNEAPKDAAYPGNVGIAALQLASANEIAKQSGTILMKLLER